MPQSLEVAKLHKVGLRILTEEEEHTGRWVVDAAFAVHKELGPGLLERVYEACFCFELARRNCSIKRQLEIPIVYHGMKFDEGLSVVCELKAVDELNPVWIAQVLSHLKLTDKHLGYLINFNVPLIKNGIKRLIA